MLDDPTASPSGVAADARRVAGDPRRLGRQQRLRLVAIGLVETAPAAVRQRDEQEEGEDGDHRDAFEPRRSAGRGAAGAA